MFVGACPLFTVLFVVVVKCYVRRVMSHLHSETMRLFLSSWHQVQINQIQIHLVGK